jgi:eukaryotic-like serine/threonine-protein kinase
VELAQGIIVAGRYRLDRRIGAGGMGVVWAAKHVLTRRPVALKFLRESSPDHQRRFLREARIAGTLRHPNIVEVHDVVVLPGDGTPVMVMDLLAGESLSMRLAQGRQIPLPELADILLPVVSAVGSAHALGVVHRDLKPDNIFLARGPSGERMVKVLDFGIAKLTAAEGDAAETSHVTRTGAVMGTPFYMSPEQVFGERAIDHRSDVWSLGVILYECLSGARPFGGDNFGQVFKQIALGRMTPLDVAASGLPDDITALVARMLQHDKLARPADLRDVHAALAVHASVRAPSFDGPASGPARSVPPPAAPVVIPGGAAPAEAFQPTQVPETKTDGRRWRARARRIVLAGSGLVVLAAVGATMAPRRAPNVSRGATPVTTSPPPPPLAAASSAPPLRERPASPPTSSPVRTAAEPKAVARRPLTARAPAMAETTAPAAPRTAPAPLPGGIHGDSPY